MIRKLWFALAFACASLVGLALLPAAGVAKSAAIPHLAVIDPAAAAPALSAPIPTLPTAPVVVVEPAKANSVTIPLNEWIDVVRNFLSTVLVALLGALPFMKSGPIAWIVRAYGLPKIVDMAVGAGINAIPGAVRYTPLSVDLGNKVLAYAVQWAVDNVPAFAVKVLGGEEGIRAHIFAALHLEADASAEALGAKAA